MIEKLDQIYGIKISFTLWFALDVILIFILVIIVTLAMAYYSGYKAASKKWDNTLFADKPTDPVDKEDIK